MRYNNILETIGNTPIVKLNRVTRDIKATILAKIEFFNPGGSIKDRIAVYMVKDAEKSGLLRPGGTIVETTSGNTGIGLAMYGAIKGYKVLVATSDRISQEKASLLKALGAKVIICPVDVPPDSPESCYEVAKRVARETPNSLLVNQFFNKKNIEAHYMTTGPEIWEQTKGKLDYIVIGAGTGGTISGVGKFLKEKNPEINVIAVDPIGSIYYDYFKHKKVIKPEMYQIEGIGEDMLPETMDFSVIDDMIQVSDKDAFLMARRLLREEGIFAGGSSGAAVWASLKVAKDLSEDKIVLTILPDGGYNYLSKIYNNGWMKEKGFIQY
ncbi:MAG: cysteine synthase family protein [candidate division WOR-3 bacterium]|nr:cysteine synthase family protein [candidate division WOR-3 bacterium]